MTSDFPGASVPKEAAVLQSMTLLATLQTAFDVWEGVEGRRTGCDPSAQEPEEVVYPWLRAARAELRELCFQLQGALLLARLAEETPLTASVRRFGLLMKIRRTERLLHGTHQRLLSLYPSVSEMLVEETRLMHRIAERLPAATPDRLLIDLPAFLSRLTTYTTRLGRALVAAE